MAVRAGSGITPEAWQAYKGKFLDPGGRIIDDANGNISHSEGQGYGLLLAVLAGNSADFELIWSFTRTELLLRSDGLAAWKWNPATKPQPGQELLFSYRLYWGADPPSQPPLARCIATRTGIGGIVGQKRKAYSRRFAVDFAGGDFALLDPRTKVEPVISVSSGKVEITSARPLAAVHGIRAMFDLVPDATTTPITMRLYLSADGQPLSETWLYELSLIHI